MLDGNFLGFGNVSTIIAGIDLYLSVLDLNKGSNGAVTLLFSKVVSTRNR